LLLSIDRLKATDRGLPFLLPSAITVPSSLSHFYAWKPERLPASRVI
jgi:hypothetical protein